MIGISEKECTKRISDIISVMRFPLLLMVVLIHCSMFYRAQGSVPVPEFAIRTMYFLSGSMCSVAVPAYFLMSGYLFFGILGRYRALTREDYRSKLYKRGWRLLLPYILWNFAGFCMMALFMLTPLKSFFPGLNVNIDFGYFIRCFWSVTDLHSFFQTAGAPVDDPMWFIRDLIILSVLSPVVEWLLRVTRGWLLVLLTGLFIAGMWPHLVGFSLTGILFYSVGAWASIAEWRIIPVLSRLWWMPIVAVACMITETIVYPVGLQYLHAMSILTGVAGGLWMAYKVSDNQALVKRLGSLGNLGFFIFAFHMLISAEVVSALCMMVRPVSDISWLLCYFGAYAILIGVSAILYHAVGKVFPTLTAMLVGAYSPHKKQ